MFARSIAIESVSRRSNEPRLQTVVREGVSILRGYSKTIDRQLCLNTGWICDGGIYTCTVDGRYLLSSYARYIFFFSFSFFFFFFVIHIRNKNIVIGQERLIERSIHHAEQQIAMKFQAFTILSIFTGYCTYFPSEY